MAAERLIGGIISGSSRINGNIIIGIMEGVAINITVGEVMVAVMETMDIAAAMDRGDIMVKAEAVMAMAVVICIRMADTTNQHLLCCKDWHVGSCMHRSSYDRMIQVAAGRDTRVGQHADRTLITP